MTPGVGIERRDANQPVNPGLGLQPAIGVGSLDLQGAGLDARRFAAGFFDHIDGHVVLGGPARIHAHQHQGPVGAFGAASARIDFHIGVVAVGLAGQQRFEFGAGGVLLQTIDLGGGLVGDSLIALHLGQLRQFQRIGQITLKLAHSFDLARQTRAVAHHGLGFLRLVPQGRVLDPGVQFIQAA